MRSFKITISLFILLISSSFIYSQIEKKTNIFKSSLNYEFKIIEEEYKICLSNTCYGDSIFYKNWYDGLISEKAENNDKAIKNYLIALNFERFELSTYEVKFSLGRIEIVNGNIKKGKALLSEFISEANSDIKDENSMWSLSEKGVKLLNDRIDFAEKLINLSK